MEGAAEGFDDVAAGRSAEPMEVEAGCGWMPTFAECGVDDFGDKRFAEVLRL